MPRRGAAYDHQKHLVNILPFVLDCHNYYELMGAQGEERIPMTSSDAETDFKPIIIIISSKTIHRD